MLFPEKQMLRQFDRTERERLEFRRQAQRSVRRMNRLLLMSFGLVMGAALLELLCW